MDKDEYTKLRCDMSVANALTFDELLARLNAKIEQLIKERDTYRELAHRINDHLWIYMQKDKYAGYELIDTRIDIEAEVQNRLITVTDTQETDLP